MLAAWVYTTQLYSGDTSPRKLIQSLKQWVISLNIVTDLATVPHHVALLKLKKEKEKASSGVKSVLSVSQVTNESVLINQNRYALNNLIKVYPFFF